MLSQALYKKFVKAVLKEEKIKLTKNEFEILITDTYLQAFDGAVSEVHDVQASFVC